MAEALVRRESPVEFFRELVEAAMRHQRLDARELTSFYVVHLLAGFVRRERSSAVSGDDPLGVRFVKALGAAGARQRDEIRHVGDLSLFISGFFSDSLNRRADLLRLYEGWLRTRSQHGGDLLAARGTPPNASLARRSFSKRGDNPVWASASLGAFRDCCKIYIL